MDKMVKTSAGNLFVLPLPLNVRLLTPLVPLFVHLAPKIRPLAPLVQSLAVRPRAPNLQLLALL